jgi:hypothetical protein
MLTQHYHIKPPPRTETEAVSETLDINSTMTQLPAWEDFMSTVTMKVSNHMVSSYPQAVSDLASRLCIRNMVRSSMAVAATTLSEGGWRTVIMPLTYVYVSMALQPFVGPWPLFQFLDLLQSAGLPGWAISPLQGRYLHTGQCKQNKRTQTSMPQVGFEPTIPVFEQVKTAHALGRTATVIGQPMYIHSIILISGYWTWPNPLWILFRLTRPINTALIQYGIRHMAATFSGAK